MKIERAITVKSTLGIISKFVLRDTCVEIFKESCCCFNIKVNGYTLINKSNKRFMYCGLRGTLNFNRLKTMTVGGLILEGRNCFEAQTASSDDVSSLTMILLFSPCKKVQRFYSFNDCIARICIQTK